MISSTTRTLSNRDLAMESPINANLIQDSCQPRADMRLRRFFECTERHTPPSRPRSIYAGTGFAYISRDKANAMTSTGGSMATQTKKAMELMHHHKNDSQVDA